MEKNFRAKICVLAPSEPTSVLTHNKGPNTEPHFSNPPPPPLLRRASMSPSPAQSNFQVAQGEMAPESTKKPNPSVGGGMGSKTRVRAQSKGTFRKKRGGGARVHGFRNPRDPTTLKLVGVTQPATRTHLLVPVRAPPSPPGHDSLHPQVGRRTEDRLKKIGQTIV